VDNLLADKDQGKQCDPKLPAFFVATLQHIVMVDDGKNSLHNKNNKLRQNLDRVIL